MTTAEELVVAMRAENAQETKDDIDDVGDSMSNVSDEAETQADEAADLSKRWSGAMTAIVTGLAAGSAFLLSKVPVVGEAMSGLGAIIDALAFQMDGVLRPILTPIGDLFFWISNKIYEAEGAWGTLIGVVATVASILAVAIPVVAAIGSQIGIWGSTALGVIAILGKFAGTIAFFVSLLEPVSTIILVVIAVLGLLAAAWAKNWLGIRDKTESAVDYIKDTVIGGFKSLVVGSLAWFGKLVDKGVGKFVTLLSKLGSLAGDLPGMAYEWGKKLMRGFLNGIKSLANLVVQAVAGVVNSMISAVNEGIDLLPDEVKSRLGIEAIEKIDASSLTIDTGGSGGGSSGGGGGGGGTTLRRQTNGRGRIAMDGRKLDESTGLYSRDRTARRGI